MSFLHTQFTGQLGVRSRTVLKIDFHVCLHRARRTTRRAAVMISAAWGISLLLWPPWIYAWPYIEGKRTVPKYKCYIQFIETNHYITFGTAIAAFYIPVSIMLFLYFKIWKETEKRQRDLSQLQAGKKDSSRRSNSR